MLKRSDDMSIQAQKKPNFNLLAKANAYKKKATDSEEEKYLG